MSVELHTSEAKAAQGAWRQSTYRSLIEGWRQERPHAMGQIEESSAL